PARQADRGPVRQAVGISARGGQDAAEGDRRPAGGSRPAEEALRRASHGLERRRYVMRLRVYGAVALALCAASAASGFALRGYVFGNGGASANPATNTSFKVYGTAGQPVVGAWTVAGKACGGFWCFAGPTVVSVDPQGASLPTKFALGPAS